MQQATSTAPNSVSAEPYPYAQPRDKRRFYWIALAVFIVDQITKWLVIQYIPFRSEAVPIPALYPYFRFSHIGNTGASFSLFPDSRWLFTFLPLLVAAGIVYFNWSIPSVSRKLRTCLGFVLGGALGNVIDRILIGHVTDFVHINVSSIIDVPLANWPVFNVADMAVVGATLYMAYLSFFHPEEIELPLPEEPDPANPLATTNAIATEAEATRVVATKTAVVAPERVPEDVVDDEINGRSDVLVDSAESEPQATSEPHTEATAERPIQAKPYEIQTQPAQAVTHQKNGPSKKLMMGVGAVVVAGAIAFLISRKRK